MASSSVLAFRYTLFILLCIGSLHTVVLGGYYECKELHLTYYVHEVRGYPQPPDATLLTAAGTGQGNFSASGWGTFYVFQHALKEGSAVGSKLLGKITGSGVVTTIGGLATGGLQLSSQHIFNANSKYDGSSLTMTGTFGFPSSGWECIITGGTGGFRGYHGYALGVAVPEAFAPPLYVYRWDLYISKCSVPRVQ